jgi:hypothetical protein
MERKARRAFVVRLLKLRPQGEGNINLITITTMDEIQISEDQRRAFLDLIKDAQKRYENDFEDYLGSLKGGLGPKLEARARVQTLMENVRHFRGKLSEAITGLRQMGFRVDDGMISIDVGTGDDLRRELDEARHSAKEERQKSIQNFKAATLAILSASTVDEARKIVEQFV